MYLLGQKDCNILCAKLSKNIPCSKWSIRISVLNILHINPVTKCLYVFHFAKQALSNLCAKESVNVSCENRVLVSPLPNSLSLHHVANRL